MRYTGKVQWLTLLAFVLAAGMSMTFFAAGTSAQTTQPTPATGQDVDSEDDVPEVTARVARISFINGGAKIRRVDAKDWENAVLNLAIVEGDEIATDLDSHVEIQFDKSTHLRLAENSFLRIVNLKDEGVAVSISLGSMNLRITKFNKGNSFFEIDAPKSTVSVQRVGSYRIDAGRDGDPEIRIAATDGGEARFYSENAGFTVKAGRSARFYIDGTRAGEWEMADAYQLSDDFDKWSVDRDAAIAKRLANAFYDKYYDDDLFGADDLDGFGEWINSDDYGWVWRPFPSSINPYDDWSPYRYGHWRWIPPFGWTWVNDEPWAWATYHYGRWVWDRGQWVWSPYGYYRPRRSWWQPALVYVTIVNNNVCWYPLGYRRRHFDYNARYHHDRDRRDNGRPSGPQKLPSPLSRSGPPRDLIIDKIRRDANGKKPPADSIPDRGVVAIDGSAFGSKGKGIKKPPTEIVRDVLTRKPDDGKQPDLPVFADVSRRIVRDILADKPKSDVSSRQVNVGAAPRKADTPLEDELRNTRAFVGRPPKTDKGDSRGLTGDAGGTFDPRKTGALDRSPGKTGDGSDKPPKPPVFTPRDKTVDPPPRQHVPPKYIPPSGDTTPRISPPTRKPPETVEQQKPRDTPRPEPSKPKDNPRSDTPPDRGSPKNDSPKPSKEVPKNDSKPERSVPVPSVVKKDKPDIDSK